METDPSLRGLADSVEKLHLRLDERAEMDRHWKALELLTGVVSNLGFLTLGTAIPVLSREPLLTWRGIFISLLPGALLVWMGVRLLYASVVVKSYFLDHEDQLPSFSKVFDHGQAPASAVLRWADRPDRRSSRVRRELRRFVLALKVGWMTTALLLGLFLVAYFTILFLVLKFRLGTWGAAGLILGLLALMALAVWWNIHRTAVAGKPATE